MLAHVVGSSRPHHGARLFHPSLADHCGTETQKQRKPRWRPLHKDPFGERHPSTSVRTYGGRHPIGPAAPLPNHPPPPWKTHRIKKTKRKQKTPLPLSRPLESRGTQESHPSTPEAITEVLKMSSAANHRGERAKRTRSLASHIISAVRPQLACNEEIAREPRTWRNLVVQMTLFAHPLR